MHMYDGGINWFYIRFNCPSGGGALKISATKHTDGFSDCRTPSRGCSCTFPLWEAHWSRKQPDRKRTSVFTWAAGSRVLRQSNLSCWKLKCDLTFYSNLNAFLYFFLKGKNLIFTIRTIEIVHQRRQKQPHDGGTWTISECDWQHWFRNTQHWGFNSEKRRLSPPTLDNDSNTGFFLGSEPMQTFNRLLTFCPPVLRCPLTYVCVTLLEW